MALALGQHPRREKLLVPINLRITLIPSLGYHFQNSRAVCISRFVRMRAMLRMSVGMALWALITVAVLWRQLLQLESYDRYPYRLRYYKP